MWYGRFTPDNDAYLGNEINKVTQTERAYIVKLKPNALERLAKDVQTYLEEDSQDLRLQDRLVGEVLRADLRWVDPVTGMNFSVLEALWNYEEKDAPACPTQITILKAFLEQMEKRKPTLKTAINKLKAMLYLTEERARDELDKVVKILEGIEDGREK